MDNEKGKEGPHGGGSPAHSLGGESAQDSPRLLPSLWHCVQVFDQKSDFRRHPQRGIERQTAAFLPLPFLPPFAIESLRRPQPRPPHAIPFVLSIEYVAFTRFQCATARHSCGQAPLALPLDRVPVCADRQCVMGSHLVPGANNANGWRS